MIISGEPHEFEPFGKDLLDSCRKNQAENGGKLLFQKMTINGGGGEKREESKEIFRIRKSDGKNVYEEIYASGKRAVWSCNNNRLLKTFTTDFDIIDAFWHSFTGPSQDGDENSQRRWDALCLIGEKSFDIYRTRDGERFQQALPFSVRRVYSTEFGLLLERAATTAELRSSRTSNDQHFPFLFSLSHPLNEIVPVIYKPTDLSGHETVRYTTNLSLNVVHSDLRYSLLLTFDKKTGCHSLWMVRKATKQDAAAASEFLQHSLVSNASTSSVVFSHSSLNTNKLASSFARSALFSNLPSLAQSIAGPSSSSGQQTVSLQQTTATASLSSGLLSHLFAAAPSSTSTPETQNLLLPAFGFDSRSPAATTMAPRSGRQPQGPSAFALTPRLKAGGGVLANPAVTKLIRMNTSGEMSSSSLNLSSRSLAAGTPKADFYQSYFPSPALNSYHAGDFLHTSVYGQSSVPFVPDVCLDLLWCESNLQTRGDPQTPCQADDSAAKVIAVEDFAGGIYFCYLISSSSQLRCLKLVRKKDGGRFTTPISPSIISCRDVAVFSDSKFMVILDQNYCLSLYSGIKKISSLYCDAMSLLSPPDKYTSEFNKSHPSRILSSSELPSISETGHGTLMRDAVDAMFSPVQADHQPEGNTSFAVGNLLSGTVSGVDTFCERSPFFLATLNSSRTCRCSVPTTEMNGSVQLCLDALKIVLADDVIVDLYSSWFMNRQLTSSSSGNPDCREIVVFMKFIMESTGFPSLKLFNKFGLANESLMEIPAKRSKCSEDGSDSDWLYLVQNLGGGGGGGALGDEFHLSMDESKTSLEGDEIDDRLIVRSTATYFGQLPTIFFALHCCYEEMKLNQLHWSALEQFGECLYVMARALNLPSYVDHYLRDCSNVALDETPIAVDESDVSRLRFPPYWSSECFGIFRHIYQIMKGGQQNSRTSMVSCCERLWVTCVLYRLLRDGRIGSDAKNSISTIGESTYLQKSILRVLDETKEIEDVSDLLAKILKLTEENGKNVVATLPPGIVVPLLLRLTPPQFRTIRRGAVVDAAKNSMSTTRQFPNQQASCREKATAKLKSDDADGMSGPILNDDLSKLLFPKDVRLHDVRNMLRSSKQTKISLKQKPGVADNEFREEQERNLYSICVRTMALPIGRGMFTLRSHRPLLAESVEIPKLCLTGRTPGPQALTIDLSHIDVPSNMDLWAKFHNGVAAGLRLAPPGSASASNGDEVEQQLDTSWIVFNMPRSSSASNNDGGGGVASALTPEHAGFLYGLGLNGHLPNLALFNLHEYLVKGDPMTSIALLLGTAAAKCRTAELQSMKMLSTHLPFLLLPTLLELNIDPSVQTAAVLGVGLLYAESGNYRLAEALVKEIGRPSTALNDNFADRESYALSCGFALGLITLGLGDMVFGDPNFTLANELCLLMNGGHKRSHHYAVDSPLSQLVKDGDFLNVHVTSAPAVAALGLMYLNSNNRQVAAWFDPPETLALLDTVRPDFLMLRAVSRSLILWDDVVPRVDWVESQVPAVVASYVSMNDEDRTLAIREHYVDLETVAQTYCNIVAGGCFALALKFAGSANADAFKCLLHYYKLFDASYQQRSPASWRKIYTKAGRYTVETALNVIVMSLGAVMAGTGNLDVLRIVRHLRQRIGPNGTNWLLHGGHSACHIALGLLFLGGGRYTLSTSNLSVAALFCSLYPKFPISPNDNRFHLQAFRHLYVLACEPRLLTTIDHLSSEVAYCNISVKFKGCQYYDDVTESLRAPCILPELDLLEEVRINDERYWPIRFSRNHDWDRLENALKSCTGLEIYRRAGYCSRKDDPLGYQSTGTLLRMHAEDWMPPPQHFPFDEAAEILESLRLWCSKRDCEYAYSNLVDLFQLVNNDRLRTINIWQLKLLLAFVPYMASNNGNSASTIADVEPPNVEFLVALEMKLRHQLCDGVSAKAVKSYIGKSGNDDSTGGATMLGEFLTFFDIPTRNVWIEAKLRDYRSLRLFLEKLTSLNIPIVTAMILHRVLAKSL